MQSKLCFDLEYVKKKQYPQCLSISYLQSHVHSLTDFVVTCKVIKDLGAIMEDAVMNLSLVHDEG